MSRDGHTIHGPAGTIRIDGGALSALVIAAAEHVDGAASRARGVGWTSWSRTGRRTSSWSSRRPTGRFCRASAVRCRRTSRLLCGTRPGSWWKASTFRSRSSTGDHRPETGEAHGPLPAVPVGSHRAAADRALRGRAGRVCTRSRGGRLGARRGARPPHHRERGRLDRRPSGYARAEYSADRDPRARGGKRAAGSGDERGRRAGEAVRVRGRGTARERDPGTRCHEEEVA